MSEVRMVSTVGIDPFFGDNINTQLKMSMQQGYPATMGSLPVEDFWYNGLPTPEGSLGSFEQVDSPLEHGHAVSGFDDTPHKSK